MVGGLPVGGGAPVSIQSMTNTRTDDVEATVAQIRRAGGGRVPDRPGGGARHGRRQGGGQDQGGHSPCPWWWTSTLTTRLALECVEAGADKVRINPGNIGGEDRVKAVARGLPPGETSPSASASTAAPWKRTFWPSTAASRPRPWWSPPLATSRLLNRYDFDDICVSLKSSCVSPSPWGPIS